MYFHTVLYRARTTAADSNDSDPWLIHRADGGPQFAPLILDRFGPRVLSIVQGCTDGVPDAQGEKAPWPDRKRRYLDHLAVASEDTLLVSGCDKLSNARAIVEDLVSIGPAVFDRFTAGRTGTLWYYDALARIFSARRVAMSDALTEAVAQMQRLAK